jgi:hypothetical protein
MPILTDQGNLLTMAMLLEHIPALTERTLRYWMATNPDRFREHCMVMVGRKSYFDLQGLERWLLDHRGARGK